jgi:site-specific recombinase XerD
VVADNGDRREPMTTLLVDLAGATASDRMLVAGIAEALRHARSTGDRSPAGAIIANCLVELGVAVHGEGRRVDLQVARSDWLRRLESSRRSASTVTAYRVALDDLISWLATHDSPDPFREETVVAHLHAYRDARQPAPATYYRRFLLLRRFYRWLSSRHGVRDPFLELDGPAKPRDEAEWLTPDEFRRLLAAAGAPPRRVPGLAERDRLVLIALVMTGLRRAELVALNWADVELDADRPSLLVRNGKGSKPRRQPIAEQLADELRAVRPPNALATDPVFVGLSGRRLQPTVLANIIRRSARHAGLEKPCTAHTLRHTAATWLRQATGDARLVAEYLGHADLSTVSRYAHVASAELHDAAATIAANV